MSEFETNELTDVDLADQLSYVQEAYHDLETTLESLTTLEDEFEAYELISLMPTQDGELTQESLQMLDMLEMSIHAGEDEHYSDELLSLEALKFSDVADGARAMGRVAVGGISRVKAVVNKAAPVIAENVIKGWDISREYYDRSFSTVESVYKQVRKTQERLDRIKNLRPREQVIELRREAVTLSMGYALPKSSRDIINALETIQSNSDYILHQWSQELKKAGDLFLRVAAQADKNTPLVSVQHLTTVAKGLDFKKVQDKLKASVRRDTRFRNVDVYVGEDLPGNYNLFIVRPDQAIRNDDNVLAVAKAYRRRKIVMKHTQGGKRMSGDKTRMEVLDIQEMQQVLKACMELEDVLARYARSGMSHTLENIGRQLGARFEKSYAITEPRHMLLSNSANRFSSAFLKWATQPSVALYSQALATIRAAVLVCQRSIAVYA